jgi:hypothetical protein
LEQDKDKNAQYSHNHSDATNANKIRHETIDQERRSGGGKTL